MLLPRWRVLMAYCERRQLNGLLGAARAAGLSTEDVSEVERALSEAVPLTDIDFLGSAARSGR